MNVRMFFGASILGGGLLFKFGAPASAVLVGVGLAALWTWKSARLSAAFGRGKS